MCLCCVSELRMCRVVVECNECGVVCILRALFVHRFLQLPRFFFFVLLFLNLKAIIINYYYSSVT